MEDPVALALASFRANREMTQHNVKALRRQLLRIVCYKRTILWPLLRPFLGFSLSSVRKEIRLASWKIGFFEQIENDLIHGKLTKAIETLAIFAPEEETLSQTAQRAIRDAHLPALEAVLKSPNVLRDNMFRLREKLIRIQASASS